MTVIDSEVHGRSLVSLETGRSDGHGTTKFAGLMRNLERDFLQDQPEMQSQQASLHPLEMGGDARPRAVTARQDVSAATVLRLSPVTQVAISNLSDRLSSVSARFTVKAERAVPSASIAIGANLESVPAGDDLHESDAAVSSADITSPMKTFLSQEQQPYRPEHMHLYLTPVGVGVSYREAGAGGGSIWRALELRERLRQAGIVTSEIYVNAQRVEFTRR